MTHKATATHTHTHTHTPPIYTMCTHTHTHTRVTSTHAYGLDASDVTEEDGDVDKHEEITDDDCDYISFTFPIDLIHNRSLQNYKFIKHKGGTIIYTI